MARGGRHAALHRGADYDAESGERNVSESDGVSLRRQAVEEVTEWLRAAQRDPRLLPSVHWCLFTRGELYAAFLRWVGPRTFISPDAFGRALRAAGVGPAYYGLPVLTAGRRARRLFALRRQQLGTRALEIAARYNAERKRAAF